MAIWRYLYLVKGRLIDSETFDEANLNWPSFDSFNEAEVYLEQNDIRATVTLELDSITKVRSNMQKMRLKRCLR